MKQTICQFPFPLYFNHKQEPGGDNQHAIPKAYQAVQEGLDVKQP